MDMRSLFGVLAFAVSVYLILLLMLYLLQGRMVYLANLPGRTLTATPADIGLEHEDVSLVTVDNEELHGWYIPATNPGGVVLFFHGNAGNISHRLESIEIFNELNLDVLIIDYRGYGQSTGKATEQGTYLDAQAAWDYLVDKRGVAPGDMVIFGRSLGGAVASWLAARTTPGAVILESCFTSGVDMAARLYPFLPARLITRLKYPVKDYVKQLSSPLLVVHSQQDEIIPFDMGQSIFTAAPEPKEIMQLSGDHNGGFLLNRERYQAAIGKFLERHFSSQNR
ncbi:MAG: alpha/beta hydrolase [Xanthomonadales bacterium]|nr:alpha/beta hydrolase [Xanthomonadales bacterium]